MNRCRECRALCHEYWLESHDNLCESCEDEAHRRGDIIMVLGGCVIAVVVAAVLLSRYLPHLKGLLH